MIARLWSARTTSAQSTTLSRAFLAEWWCLCSANIRRLRLAPASWCGPTESRSRLLVVTVWQSFDAIDAFAGSDRETAVVASEACRALDRLRPSSAALRSGSNGWPLRSAKQ